MKTSHADTVDPAYQAHHVHLSEMVGVRPITELTVTIVPPAFDPTG